MDKNVKDRKNYKKLKVEVVANLDNIPEEWKEWFDDYGINAADPEINENGKKLVINIDNPKDGIVRDPKTGALVVSGTTKVRTSSGKVVDVNAKAHFTKKNKEYEER